ncbi:LysR substrate-binding domain-containing protein [Paraburkholderia sacchari]|uniref:LysR substrate-binding domain-containing protein n=1 Tax=Paraburkholderia sacchari TaxID=159450 RepID=UPI00054447E1|nr:LysR substrate-binding domain-containing protein [Paraburkholderia sacchari]NLP62078.1 LysR family transcriptional regulator [Paraburkholderia sacchari]
MELRQLRYFVGVAEAGSLLKASGRLGVAQPALGQQIAMLEHEVSARLFDRSSRGMSLTDSGRLFLEHARVVLADAERARMAVRDCAAVPRGEVALGLPTTVALAATMPILSACRTELPHVRLKLVEAYSGFLREWLQSGRLDLALLYGESVDPGLSRRPLLDDQLVFVTSTAKVRLPKRLLLKEVARWPLVLPGPEHALRRIIDDACAPERLELNVVALIESLSSVKRAVEAGIGSTILPLGSVAQEVADGKMRTAVIDNPHMQRRVVCATNVTRPASLACAAVTALTQRVIREMVESGAWPARWVGG